MPRLTAGTEVRCRRCGEKILYARKDTLDKVLWLVASALILYIPANLFPILSVEKLGAYSESTIWQGAVQLYQNGYWGVALLVLFASIVVPLTKLIALLYLSAAHRSARHRKFKTRLLMLIRRIGPWSMLDVFLVAILVALVKLGDLVTVKPGPGLVAFSAVVLLTTMASSIFEPRLLWLKKEPDHD